MSLTRISFIPKNILKSQGSCSNSLLTHHQFFLRPQAIRNTIIWRCLTSEATPSSGSTGESRAIPNNNKKPEFYKKKWNVFKKPTSPDSSVSTEPVAKIVSGIDNPKLVTDKLKNSVSSSPPAVNKTTENNQDNTPGEKVQAPTMQKSNRNPSSTVGVQELSFRAANSRGDYEYVIRMIEKAKEESSQLSTFEYISGLNACAQLNPPDVALAMWIFDSMKEVGKPLRAFEHMITICNRAKMKEVELAIKIINEFKTTGYKLTDIMLSDFLEILAFGERGSSTGQLLDYYYNEYCSSGAKNRSRISPQIYIILATAYCDRDASEKCLSVLSDMTDAHYEPTPELCAPLLGKALLKQEPKILRVLSSWYSKHFQLGVEYGVITRILQTASAKGDGQLAEMAFQMLGSNGYTPSRSDYICLVNALLGSDDTVAAVEALQELEARGYRFCGRENQPTQSDKNQDQQSNRVEWRQYRSLKRRLAIQLSGMNAANSAARDKNLSSEYLDKFYFALVDQVGNNNRPVPRIVLDALLEAAGILGLTNRAFATFQEYSVVFKLPYTVGSYVSLLNSCLLSKARIQDLLSIFQDLEQFIQKNPSVMQSETYLDDLSEGYNALLRAMHYQDDFRVFDEIFAHMLSKKGVVPEESTLRRLLLNHNLRKEEARSNQILTLLKKEYYQGDRKFPQYLENRLSSLKNKKKFVKNGAQSSK